MIKKLILSGVSGALLTMSSLASATSLIKQDFTDMVKTASACVVAEKMSTQYIEEQGAMVTLTTFSVSESAFGDTEKTITVRTAGGVKKTGKLSTTEVVAGAPQFFNKHQSLLLLNELSSGDYNIVGFSQGVFPVVETSEGAMVSLPENMGGNTSVDDALDLVIERRNATSTTTIAQ